MTIPAIVRDVAIGLRNTTTAVWPLMLARLTRPHASPPISPPRFAVIPADTGSIAGSLGDLAMLTGLIGGLRARHPDAVITVIGQRDQRIAVPESSDVAVVRAWQGISGSRAFDHLIRSQHGLYVMGADVLDGKYGAALVARIAAYCNHAVRLGVPVTTLGFSFNSRPRRPAVAALASLHRDVLVNLRDAQSLARFERHVARTANLCADCAFLMPPANQDNLDEVEEWIARARADGQTLIGVNLSTHALATGNSLDSDRIVVNLAAQLRNLAQQRPLACLLIPHDIKPRSGDITLLRALDRLLVGSDKLAVRYAETPRPDRIKRWVGQLDLVLTGRMHLAIAALGSGTPIVSITYQDKFEGLYQHFDLPLTDTLQAADCLNDTLGQCLDSALARHTETRAQITARLPAVRELAARNLLLRRPGFAH
ncbi:MAG: hypothetical protein B7Y26_01275 [Hydrogenophilales bacterium 16-64-46]|nr:MAG: hypothetical protein B7Y26_01275 [Hydrogenophilales bacterium 16-64-46]OZA37284.1 MAG: hypothetical protein B7X87_11210 [Hydrogenophilales bacterium 17-64-34]HQS98966.1 polysaccharide pyruvyl transferase family protein [Thiobacillus sp.]